MLELLENQDKQQELSENIKKLGITDAAARIAEELTKLMENK